MFKFLQNKNSVSTALKNFALFPGVLKELTRTGFPAFWRLQLILVDHVVGSAVKDLDFFFSYCYSRNEPVSRSSHSITL